MSRINVGVSPQNLTDQHLLAEHREIKRICDLYLKWNKDLSSIPTKFTLGTGHLKFFLDKGMLTQVRYDSIHQECLFRGFHVQNYLQNWRVYATEHFNSYIVSDADRELITDRISLRILESNQVPRYYGCDISKERAIKILLTNQY